jgi:hypothetical protein
MLSLFDLAVHAFVALMREPFLAFIGFAVMGVGAARVLRSGSIIRGALLGVAIIGTVASGLAAATQTLGGPSVRGTISLR